MKKVHFLIIGVLSLLCTQGVMAQDWAADGASAEDELLAQEAALLEEMRNSQKNMDQEQAAQPRARADIASAIDEEQQKLQQLQGQANEIRDHVIRMKGNNYAQETLPQEARKASSHSESPKKPAQAARVNTETKSEKASGPVSPDRLDSYQERIQKQEETITKLKQSNTSLQGKLAVSQDKISVLRKELEETRNQLIVAEAEVSRLSRMIEKRNSDSLARYGTGISNTSDNSRAAMRIEKQPQPKATPDVYAAKASADMDIATVTVDKANLRTGPGLNNSPLMSVGKGTRLAVETRKGDWYRIIAPTGVRAWVSGDVIAFGKDAHSSPTRTVSIKAYDSSIEQEAFQLIQKSGR